MEIKKVGVLGCGLMGSGIAQVAAAAGCDVVVLEQEQKFLDKGFAGIEKSLSRLVERGVAKGGITAEQKTETQSRLKGTTNMQDLADCDIVIEAIIENVGREAQDLRRARRHRQEGRHLRHQHVFHLRHRADDGDQAARALHRPALLQSRAR